MNDKEFICLVRGHQIVTGVKYTYKKSRQTQKVRRCVHCEQELMPSGRKGWVTTREWAMGKMLKLR